MSSVSQNFKNACRHLRAGWCLIIRTCKCECLDLFCKILFLKCAFLWFCSLKCTVSSGISWMYHEWKNLCHFRVHQLNYIMSPACFSGGINTYEAQTSVFLLVAELQWWSVLKEVDNDRDSALDLSMAL